MKKLLSLTLMAVGLVCMTSHRAEAVWFKGAPKEVFISSYTTGPIQVTPSVSTNVASAAQYQPGALYQVILSTGSSGEYLVILDTTSCQGFTTSTTVAQGNLPAQGFQWLAPRLYYASTTANTVITFDPPVRFDQGLCILDSVGVGNATLTYELGRGVSGQ